MVPLSTTETSVSQLFYDLIRDYQSVANCKFNRHHYHCWILDVDLKHQPIVERSWWFYFFFFSSLMILLWVQHLAYPIFLGHTAVCWIHWTKLDWQHRLQTVWNVSYTDEHDTFHVGVGIKTIMLLWPRMMKLLFCNYTLRVVWRRTTHKIGVPTVNSHIHLEWYKANHP